MKSPARLVSLFLSLGLVVAACVPPDPPEQGLVGQQGSGSGGMGSSSSGGSSASGGATGSGGGVTSTGGTSVSSGGASGTGGAVASGGSAASGGATATGGRSGTGGAGTGGGGTGGSTISTGGATSMGGTSGTVTFAQVGALLATNCATANCHANTVHIDLRNDAGLHGRLVNGKPNGTMTMTACKSMTLVVPGNAATSVLSQVVKAKVTGCTNARMPNSCSTSGTNPRACLTAPQIATIDNWIAAGAPM